MSPHPALHGGCLLSGGLRLVGCLVMLLLLPAFAVGFDILTAPWAYSLFSRSSLTGHWLGTFTTPSGIHFALYLEVERSFLTASSGEESGTELFNGHGRWCDDRGRRSEDNILSGSVPMFSGYTGSVENVQIHLEPVKPGSIGLVPANLKGRWQLDTLTLIPDLAYWTGNGYQTSSANPDQTQPITIRMQKTEADAFESDCAQWSHSAP